MSLPATLPYVRMSNARLACRHEYGGELHTVQQLLRPYWAWYEAMMAEVGVTDDGAPALLRVAASHTFALTFGCDMELPGDPYASGQIAVYPALDWRDPHLVLPLGHAPREQWQALVAVDMDLRRGWLLGMAHRSMFPFTTLPADQLLHTVPNDVCRCCGGLRGDARPGVDTSGAQRAKKGGR